MNLNEIELIKNNNKCVKQWIDAILGVGGLCYSFNIDLIIIPFFPLYFPLKTSVPRLFNSTLVGF